MGPKYSAKISRNTVSPSNLKFRKAIHEINIITSAGHSSKGADVFKNKNIKHHPT